MFSPCLLPLAEDLGVSASSIKWAITIFLLGAAIGAYSSAFAVRKLGQRLVLIISFLFFAIISYLCSLVESYDQLLVGRFLQGIFAGVFPAMGFGLIQQLYESKHASKVMSYVSGSFAVLPAIAPVIGGEIVEHSGWQPAFLVAAIVSCIVGASYFFWFKEPTKPDQNISYKTIVQNPRYMLMVVIASLIYSGEWCYLTSIQFIFSMPPENFGYAVGIITSGFLMGSVVSAKLSKNWDLIDIVYLGVQFCVFAGIALLAISNMTTSPAVFVIIGLMLYTFGHGLLFAPSATLALQALPSAIAYATGLRTSIFISIGMLGPIVATGFQDHGLTLLGVYLFVVSMISAGILFLNHKRATQ